MMPVRAAVFAALFLFGQALAATAQDVTLRARDGAIELSGTLLGFDGAFYRIATEYGELTVDGSGVHCEGPGCPSLTDFVAEITLSGAASAGAVLMPALIEGFARRTGLRATRLPEGPSAVAYELRQDDTLVGRFHLRLGTTDAGFVDLLEGAADVVIAVREIRDTEIAAARAAGLGQLDDTNRSRVLALDAVIPVVAAGNPVSRISVAELARVASGAIANWRALGGPDAPVALHLTPEGSGLRQTLEDRLMRPAGTALRADATVHPDAGALVGAVAADPFGLGLARFSRLGNAKPLVLAGRCGFALAGTRRSIKTEDWPLTAPIFLYLPARRLPALARDFLAYTRSPPAQIVIRRAGFVDQTPEAVPVDAQGDRFANAIAVTDGPGGLDRLQQMTATLRKMQRLTTSFRFEPGSAALDAQSRSNVQQLARAIEAGTYDARGLVFVGFSDGDGPAEANLAIAQRRAEAVHAAVMKAAETADPARLDVGVTAYGEALPMACDDTEWGRQVNRRVEVWIE